MGDAIETRRGIIADIIEAEADGACAAAAVRKFWNGLHEDSGKLIPLSLAKQLTLTYLSGLTGVVDDDDTESA